MNADRTTRRGFTLVEVLATLVLLGLVLPAVMRGVSLSMNAASHARRTLEAAQLAQGKIAEMLVVRDPMGSATSGTFGNDWPDYRWELQVGSGPQGTYLVTVRVLWMERGIERSLEQSTLVYATTSTTPEADTTSGETSS